MVIEFIKHISKITNGNVVIVGGTGRYLRGYRNKDLNQSFVDVSFKTTDHFNYFGNEMIFQEIENTFPYPCTKRYVGRTKYNGKRYTMDIFINPQEYVTMVVNLDDVEVITLTDKQDLWYTKNLINELSDVHPRHYEKYRFLCEIFNISE